MGELSRFSENTDRSSVYPPYKFRNAANRCLSYLQLVDHVNKRLLETEEDSRKLMNLVLYIETAIGLINLKEILQHASELSEMSRAVIDAVVFGSDDFTASIGEWVTHVFQMNLNVASL